MLDSATLHSCCSRSTPTWLPQRCQTSCLLLPTAYSACYKVRSPCKPNSRKFQSPQFSLSLVRGLRRMSSPIFALKKRGKGGVGLTEPSDSDVEFDGFFDEDSADFQDEEGEEGMLLPLKKMKEWLAGKPRGFGEGKEYDTSIEDKLLEEIEQGRIAQAANINKLKNESSQLNSNTNVVDIQAPDVTGSRVRVINLPKKKNIHRDLMTAFKGFPGIVNIVPAVVGSKKTRDPICKGFAFVDFQSEGDAIRFSQAFSGQYLMFGKIQKKIKCEITNQRASSSARESSVGSTNHARLTILEDEAEQVTDLNMDSANEVIRTREEEDIEENAASVSELHSDDEDDNGAESRTESKILSSSQKELEEPLSRGKEEIPGEVPPIKGKTKVSNKKEPKEKGERKPLIGIPGSSKRLKVKEKAVLTDVYSRYGTKSAFVSKEGN